MPIRTRALLAGLALACLAGPVRADASAAIRYSEADYVFARSGLTPPLEAAWQPVTLPDRWKENWPGITGTVWYRIVFSAPTSGDEPWMIYLPRLREGGALFINGRLLASVREPGKSEYVRWMRPHAFLVSPSELREGRNELHVRVNVASQDKTMSTITIGPETAVRPLYESRHLWTYTAAQVTIFVTLAVAAIVIGIWLRRRMDFDYGLFGLAALFWGLHTTNYVVETLPEWAWLPWRIMRYAATGGFVVAMTLFMLRFAGIRRRGFTRVFGAYWLTGPLALAVGGAAWHHAVDRYYQAGLIVIALFMVGVAVYAGWRQRTPGALALGATVIAGIVVGVHDYLLSQGIWFDPEEPFLLYFAADALLAVVGVLLVDRFVKSLAAAESAKAERERALSNERQRIMQDMHDGLGSQLLSSLAAAERGALDAKGMAQVLREAVDDMRLAIDTLSPGREGLLEALGNLRYRLEPRFRAAGIELDFSYRGLPERLDVDIEDALQILRVLQESLTNVLKHARATRVAVEVSLAGTPPRFVLAVSDDGRGFDASVSDSGRGLSGMRRRAQALGAALEVATGAQGTRILLSYPLRSAA